jgi:hypothetical protein
VARLDRLDPDAPHRRAAEAFVAERLRPAWATVRCRLVDGCARLGLAPEAELAGDETCASPSDFGFHNALANETGGISFLDFEYAGRDDPAKLIADFACQPEIPVPPAYHHRFVDGVLTALGLGDSHRERARLLIDTYRIKWLCIMLNELLPTGAARRAFAAPGTRAARCADRLAEAASAIELLETA